MGGSLKEIRERIRSVSNTQQITKAMKMVSAAKLRKAQQAIVQLRPYAEKQNQMLGNILSNLGGEADITFGKVREVKHVCLVVVTSNRGLCGAFNSNIIKSAVATIQEKYSSLKNAGNLTVMCIGKKGYDFFRKRYPELNIVRDHVDLFHDLSFEHVSRVTEELMNAFSHGEYDVIEVAYGKFKNAATQFTVTEQFLPVVQAQDISNSKRLRADYIFEPDMKSLLDYLVPSILKTSFYKFILDTHASEHGARMTAMGKASDNAEDLLKELRLTYNKARQETITKELLEIVGGAAALQGG
jgi:F-type H+-transporting ATPase subunit gamma